MQGQVVTMIITFIGALFVLSEPENSDTGLENTIIELLTFTFGLLFLKMLYPIVLHLFPDAAGLSHRLYVHCDRIQLMCFPVLC